MAEQYVSQEAATQSSARKEQEPFYEYLQTARDQFTAFNLNQESL